MLKRWLFWGLAWLAAWWIAPAVYAQTTDQYRVVATHGDRGELTCTTVLEDGLWFGTLGSGMLRVSGQRIDRFGAGAGLPGERVRDCLVDGATLWVATDAGLARWDARTERFAAVSGGRFLRLAAGGGVRVAADGLGRVYAIERGRLRVLTKLEFAPSALAVSADGARWAAASSLGRLFVSSETVQPVLQSAGLQHAEPVEGLRFRGEALEIRTTDHMLEYTQQRVHVTRSGSTAVDIDVAPAPLMAAPARVRAETRWHGARVVATDRGAFLRELHADRWQPLDLGAAFPCGDRISALAVHQGVLWAGSFDRGLCRRDADGWTQIAGPGALPSDMINDLVSDGQRLYAGTARGLAVLGPDGSFRQYEHRNCIGQLQRDCPWSAPVNGVALDAQRGELWVSDLRAVHRIDTSGWKHISGDAVGSVSLTRLAAHGGELAAGSGDHGVLIGRGKRFERIDDQAGLADNWVMDVTYDRAGRLWAATCTRGVSVRDSGGRWTTLTSEDGLIDDYTLSVNAIGDALWIGTLSGASIVRDGRIVQSLSTADGLSGNEVHDAIEFEGQVWLATDAGLSVLTAATSSARP